MFGKPNMAIVAALVLVATVAIASGCDDPEADKSKSQDDYAAAKEFVDACQDIDEEQAAQLSEETRVRLAAACLLVAAAKDTSANDVRSIVVGHGYSEWDVDPIIKDSLKVSEETLTILGGMMTPEEVDAAYDRAQTLSLDGEQTPRVAEDVLLSGLLTLVSDTILGFVANELCYDTWGELLGSSVWIAFTDLPDAMMATGHDADAQYPEDEETRWATLACSWSCFYSSIVAGAAASFMACDVSYLQEASDRLTGPCREVIYMGIPSSGCAYGALGWVTALELRYSQLMFEVTADDE